MQPTLSSIISPGGRVVIPQALREELGLKVGDRIVFERTADSVRIHTLDHAIARAQALVAQHIPSEIDLQADLRQMRRQEFQRETGDS